MKSSEKYKYGECDVYYDCNNYGIECYHCKHNTDLKTKQLEKAKNYFEEIEN